MIRTLGAADTSAFVSLRKRALDRFPFSFGAAPEDAPPFESTRKNLATKHQEDFILGYFYGEKLLGTLGLVRHQRLKKRHKAFIWGVFVEPGHQKKGVGKELMTEALRRVRRLAGIRSVHLSVTRPSQAAIRLYEGFGFKQWGVEAESLYVNGQYVDEIFMRLDLDQAEKPLGESE